MSSGSVSKTLLEALASLEMRSRRWSSFDLPWASHGDERAHLHDQVVAQLICKHASPARNVGYERVHAVQVVCVARTQQLLNLGAVEDAIEVLDEDLLEHASAMRHLGRAREDVLDALLVRDQVLLNLPK